MTGALDIVATKSFGDLVIALTAIRRGAATEPAPRLLLGEHLVPLFDALAQGHGEQPVVLLRHGESGVPSAYDIRKNGVRAATASLLRLRGAIHEAARGAGAQRLLFDRMGWRERAIAGHTPAVALPARGNIYLAYEAVLGAGSRPAPRPGKAGGIVGVFPGSRLARKNLPRPLIEHAIRAIAAQGARARLCLLEGERPDLELAELAPVIVPRSFAAMVAAVSACDAVVSADSLPAHLAEALGVPVFVASPVPNAYWLPRSAFLGRRWCLFDHAVEEALAPFLSDACRPR